jgi:hypothetical protein
MIRVRKPDDSELSNLREKRRVFYWSSSAEMVLRKHGLSASEANGISSPSEYCISLMGRSELPKVGFCEGPLHEALLRQLRVDGTIAMPSSVSLNDHSGDAIGQLLYSRFLVKKIPSNRKESTSPHEYIDQDVRWHAPQFTLQYFPNPSPDWEILATADFEDHRRVPVVLRRGSLVISGCSFFDLFGFNHAMPALDEAFYTSHVASYQYPVEKWFVELLKAHAGECGVCVQQKPVWPAGATSALSLRHDYDRPISMKQLMEMLVFYAETGIKATWFLLVGNKMPPKDQVEAMVALGHEVALHTVASTLEEFLSEVVAFRQATGIVPAGFTCHGGIGSSGHLALTHNRWAMQAGMTYGEMIGRCRGLPHPIVCPTDTYIKTLPLIVHNCHFSLDLNTSPSGHHLAKLLHDVPSALRNGVHVIIMNHPDIHWAELQRLIESLTLSNVWACTMKQAATHATKRHIAN